MQIKPLPQLSRLPSSLPNEGAVNIELEEGVPIFRASQKVQNHIEQFLSIQKESGLSLEQEQELDNLEELDDYLSFVNRTIRNLYFT